jgi:hypothetical protein
MATNQDRYYDGVKSSVKDSAAGVFSFTQRQVDRVVSPDTRQKAYSNTSDFAAAKPLLFVRISSPPTSPSDASWLTPLPCPSPFPRSSTKRQLTCASLS